MPKSAKNLFNNDMLMVVGGLLLVYLLFQYSKTRTPSAPVAVPVVNSAPVNNAPSAPPAPPPVQAVTENKPQDLLPQDSNSEWSEFAPHGQGDLEGSGSLLHPQISQRPFNSVQGANALRGDPQIAITEVPSIAAPSNPIQGNAKGLN